MVEAPDLDRAVFVRCLGVPRDMPEPRRRYGGGLDIDDNDDNDEDELDRMDVRFGEVEVLCGFTGEVHGGGDEEDVAMRGHGGGGEKVVKMRRGEIWMVRWSAVKEMFARGVVELV